MDKVVPSIVGAKGFPLRSRIEPAGERDTFRSRLFQEKQDGQKNGNVF